MNVNIRSLSFCLLSFFVLFMFVYGCGGQSRRIEVDKTFEFEGTGTDSQDLRTVCEKMARSIVTLPQISNAKHPPKIAFLEIRNQTSEIINKELFLDKIRTLLIKYTRGRVLFLDRAIIDSIIEERELKKENIVGSSNPQLKVLLGADYFLTGEMMSIDKRAGDKQATYTRYSFRLTDAESSAVVWEDDYEMKKVKEVGQWDM